MSAAYNTFFLVQWLIYVVRLVASFGYGILQFISKPGSRYIVPAALLIAMYLNWTWLTETLAEAIDYYSAPAHTLTAASVYDQLQRGFTKAVYGSTVDPWMSGGLLICGFLLVCCAYVVLSRALSVVLGAFPKVTRPLPPLRRLRPTSQNIKSAVVKLAVPRL